MRRAPSFAKEGKEGREESPPASFRKRRWLRTCNECERVSAPFTRSSRQSIKPVDSPIAYLFDFGFNAIFCDFANRQSSDFMPSMEDIFCSVYCKNLHTAERSDLSRNSTNLSFADSFSLHFSLKLTGTLNSPLSAPQQSCVQQKPSLRFFWCTLSRKS